MTLGQDTQNRVYWQGELITYQEYLIRTGQYKPPLVTDLPSSTTIKNAYSPGGVGFVPGATVRYDTVIAPDPNSPTMPGNVTPTPTTAKTDKPLNDGKPLEIMRAVKQDNGDIAFQLQAGRDAQLAGILSTYNVASRSKLTVAQRQQLEEYIKAHPEQQFAKRTADEKIAYYNRYGMAVYEGQADPLETVDPFVAGDKLNDQGAATQKNNGSPLVIPFYYGGATQNMGLLMPDTMVYPMPWDVATVYPQKIPLSMQEDPRSGLYAVGFEGTVQNNIYFDPVSGKFYNRFISSPSRAIDVMSYSRDKVGQQSGMDMVNSMISMNEKQIIVNPLNKGWIKENVTPSLSSQVKDVIKSHGINAGPNLPEVKNLGISPDSPFAKSVQFPSIGPSVNESVKKKAYMEASEFGQQFAISMIPIPGFIAKPIGKVASSIIGKAAAAPVAGKVVTGYMDFASRSPADILRGAKYRVAPPFVPSNDIPTGLRTIQIQQMKPVNEIPTIDLSKMGPNAITMENAFTGMSQSGKVATRMAARDAMADRSLGLIKSNYEVNSLLTSRIAARDAMAARQLANVQGEYQAGLLGNFMANVESASVKNSVNSMVTFELARMLPYLGPGIAGSVITNNRQRQQQQQPYHIPVPGISPRAPDVIPSPGFNFINPPVPKPKPKPDEDTPPIVIPTPYRPMPEPEPVIPTPRTPAPTPPGPEPFIPWPMPPGRGGSRPGPTPTPKIRMPNLMVDPFKVKQSKQRGSYTYKNNPDKLLGAIGATKISMPKIGTSGSKKGRAKKKGIFGLL